MSQVVHTVSPPYRDIDTLKFLVLSKGDVTAYDELRFSIRTLDLVPYSEVMVHQYNYYPAFIDLYVAYTSLFKRYKIAIPGKIRQKCNDYLKKVYMTGDHSAKTLLYVRYKDGIYLDKDTALASLIKRSDTAVCLSPADTLIFYSKANVGDVYTFFFVVSDKVQGAQILIYGPKGRREFTYNKSDLNRIGCSDDIDASCNDRRESDMSDSIKELESLLRTTFVQHGGRIEKSGWWIFVEKI